MHHILTLRRCYVMLCYMLILCYTLMVHMCSLIWHGAYKLVFVLDFF